MIEFGESLNHQFSWALRDPEIRPPAAASSFCSSYTFFSPVFSILHSISRSLSSSRSWLLALAFWPLTPGLWLLASSAIFHPQSSFLPLHMYNPPSPAKKGRLFSRALQGGIPRGHSPRQLVPRFLPESVRRFVTRILPGFCTRFSTRFVPRFLGQIYPGFSPGFYPQMVRRFSPRFLPRMVPRFYRQIYPRFSPRFHPGMVPRLSPRLLRRMVPQDLRQNSGPLLSPAFRNEPMPPSTPSLTRCAVDSGPPKHYTSVMSDFRSSRCMTERRNMGSVPLSWIRIAATRGARCCSFRTCSVSTQLAMGRACRQQQVVEGQKAVRSESHRVICCFVGRQDAHPGEHLAESDSNR
jgi:hypothetical protein